MIDKRQPQSYGESLGTVLLGAGLTLVGIFGLPCLVFGR